MKTVSVEDAVAMIPEGAFLMIGGFMGVGTPERLIADRGYDSNLARAMLAGRGIDPIIPKRENNRKATHQDSRKLRRYGRRWIIERTHAWMQNFRRLAMRYERLVEVYQALVHMAFALICLRKVLG